MHGSIGASDRYRKGYTMQTDPLLSLLMPKESGIGAMPSHLRCSKCDTIHPIELFQKNKLGKYGLNPWCRHCQTVRMRVYRAKLKEKAKL
jgi:hypothetical protein